MNVDGSRRLIRHSELIPYINVYCQQFQTYEQLIKVRLLNLLYKLGYFSCCGTTGNQSKFSNIFHKDSIPQYFQQRLKEIRQEWEFVARGLDRIFLFSFIFFTIIYQLWLLSQTNITPNKITEEFMNRTSAA